MTLVTTGWVSRFDNAVSSRHSIVLFGNILDLVWSHPVPRQQQISANGQDNKEKIPSKWDADSTGDGKMEMVLLPEWLRRHLEWVGYQPVVLYNNAEPPRVLSCGPNATQEEGQRKLDAMYGDAPEDHAEPRPALRMLARLLRDREHRAAVIIDNSVHRLTEPSAEATLLRQLTRPDSSGVPAHGLVVHLYTADSHIPPDFITADPDGGVILVSKPDFDERKRLFDQLEKGVLILQTLEGGGRVDTSRLARVTEGYRLREIQQLCQMVTISGQDLQELLSVYRNGRAPDPWRSVDMAKVRQKLFETVQGQDEVLLQVLDAILIARQRVAGLIDDSERLPAITLALVGPTGVGKTLLARTIAAAVTGSEENLKRFDMAEFQREHSDQRLIGSPPGFVGHLQGGQLTNWVLEKPCSVVLIDEWEKSADRIQDIWLQVLSGARLTDGKGQTVDFSNVILIFTSNIGGAEAKEKKIGPSTAYRDVEEHFKTEVSRYFAEDLGRPEIFGRVKHGVVVFRYIGETTARGALIQRLQSMTEGVEKRFAPHVSFQFLPLAGPFNEDRKVVDELLARSGYEEFGLRDINNVIRERVGGALARKVEEIALRIADGQTGFKARFRWDAIEEKIQVVI